MNTSITTDLTQQAPRSPRVRLGGFAHLPRLIDKARATVNERAGVYIYGRESLLDLQFFKFTGITPDELLAKVSEGLGDFEILEWIHTQTPYQLLPHQIDSWSTWIEKLPGLNPQVRAWIAEFSLAQSPPRTDVGTLFEYLDLDDYVRFGGKA